MSKAEIRVKTNDPDYLDFTVQSLGGVVVEGSFQNGVCTVRALSGDAGFLAFAIQQQGYGEVVEE